MKKKVNNIYKNKRYIENPEKIQFYKNIVDDSFTLFWIDNVFCLFTSIDDILYLIYANVKNSIITYNMIDNKKIIEIKNAHKRPISNFRNFLDKKNKRNLIISMSYHDNNLKIWNTKNWTFLLDIKKVNKSGYLWSACLLNDNNNKTYVITSNFVDRKKYEILKMKVLDLKGKIIKEIEDSNDNTFFIDIYYETSKINKIIINYIINILIMIINIIIVLLFTKKM